jgi:hypothetical protein
LPSEGPLFLEIHGGNERAKSRVNASECVCSFTNVTCWQVTETVRQSVSTGETLLGSVVFEALSAAGLGIKALTQALDFELDALAYTKTIYQEFGN